MRLAQLQSSTVRAWNSARALDRHRAESCGAKFEVPEGRLRQGGPRGAQASCNDTHRLSALSSTLDGWVNRVARVFPSDVSRLALAGASNPELATLALLKKRLSDDFTIFHGVHWSREYAKWTHFGEVDFVVVNRSGDVLLIEQKNGALVDGDDGLVKQYADGDKNVNHQIRRSVDKVHQKFKWQNGAKRKLNLDYLIHCPDHRVVKVNSAALDMSRIVDAGAKDALPARIQFVLGAGNPDDWSETVRAFFRQTLDLVPDIHAHIDAQETAFVRQAGGLADLLSRLEMEPLRLRIRGTAGCGKSLVARTAFDRAVENGRRPLMVCFNRSLAERLRARVAAGGYVDTWNGFCAKFLESQGGRLDFAAASTNPRFWHEVQEQVIGAAIPDGWLFDTLVVDEGQDFEQEWFDILKLFLRPDAGVLWLEDADQNIYGKKSVSLPGFVGYRANTNFRSPESIAAFIRDVLPFHFEIGNDLPGLGVSVHPYDEPDDQLRIVARLVRNLNRRGFTYHDIVVLSCRGIANSIFSGQEKIGSVRLRRFTGAYDLFGNQLSTDGQLAFDSVYRFKGQEAPAVILVDVDPNPDRFDSALRLLYCAMTRATVRLEVVVNQANEMCVKMLRRLG